MNQYKVTLLGGGILALLMSSSTAMAQNYTESYYPGTESTPSVVVKDYRDKSTTPYSQSRGSYYSQYYRPRMLPAPVVTSKSPVDLLEESINKVIRFLSRPQQASLEQITYFLKQEITPHFDFRYMARWVAGRYYKTMSPEQQRQFTETFAELFITTFVQKLSSYQSYPPVVDDFISRRTSENEALASARVIQENGRSIQADFKFIKTPQGWKVVDVRANGVSALFYYRNFFAEQINRQKHNQATFQ
jgi:phospholipid transport system substrate-binding protein